ncbi:hypothetical protein ACOSQ3_021747 [Xanthoceras sorbifolium]
MAHPQVLEAPTLSAQNDEQDANRHLANYHPSIWGDFFLSYASHDSMEADDDNKKHQKLKEEIKGMLADHANKPPKEVLELIDEIQHLGVSYNFQSEVDEILEIFFEDENRWNLGDDDGDADLFHISLQFRLLRQHGYKISCDVFKKFKDSNGGFKASLVSDVRGMVSLYEAAHLRVHGENILDEALAFTTSHLDSSSMAAHDQFSSSNPLAEQARRALDRPIRKSLIRPEARHYMSVYQEDPLHNEVVLAFAKLDFNILQKLHQKELSDITQWWKSLNISQKLPFVRDRVVELYFWVIGVYFEPEHSMARRILTKVISMISIIDDIYDSYGTIQELELFTVAIERWDISATDQLPEYMKVSYEAVLDVYNEIEIYLANEGKLYRLHYAKEMMKTLVRVYFVEAQWCERKYVPTMEEYMAVALLSCGYTTLASSSFVGMGDIATEDAFDWVSSNPKIIKASSIINRLMDDIVSHEFEQKRGHVASAVECYIKEHGVSEEEVAKLFREQVENAWKDMNEELLKPTVVSAPLLELVLNLARVMDLLYKKDDCYTNSYLMKDHVASLLRDPVLL